MITAKHWLSTGCWALVASFFGRTDPAVDPDLQESPWKILASLTNDTSHIAKAMFGRMAAR